MQQEHRHKRSVLRFVLHLLDRIPRLIDRRSDALPQRRVGRRLIGVERDAIHGRRRCERRESKKRLVAIPLAAQPGQRAQRRQRNLPLELAVAREHLQPRRCVAQRMREQSAADDADVLQHRFAFGNQFAPILASDGEARGVAYEHAVARRVPIRVHVQPIVLCVAGEPGVEAVEHGHESAVARRAVAHVKLRLAPALHDRHHEPASVGRELEGRPVLPRAAGAEDFHVALRVRTDVVVVHVAMIVLFAGRIDARLRVARVIKAARIRLPSDAARAREWDRVEPQLARIDFEHP